MMDGWIFSFFLPYSYRADVLRVLPNLEKLDNIDVTKSELEEALNSRPRSGSGGNFGSNKNRDYSPVEDLHTSIGNPSISSHLMPPRDMTNISPTTSRRSPPQEVSMNY